MSLDSTVFSLRIIYETVRYFDCVPSLQDGNQPGNALLYCHRAENFILSHDINLKTGILE